MPLKWETFTTGMHQHFINNNDNVESSRPGPQWGFQKIKVIQVDTDCSLVSADRLLISNGIESQ